MELFDKSQIAILQIEVHLPVTWRAVSSRRGGPVDGPRYLMWKAEAGVVCVREDWLPQIVAGPNLSLRAVVGH
jgi:hypothetical protein